MKKILYLILCGTLLFCLTGCGNSENLEDSKKQNTDSETNGVVDEQNQTDEIDKTSIENVLYDYFKDIDENHDLEAAYQYYDYTGLYTWIKLGLPYGFTSKEKLANFMENYNKYKNDQDVQNKIQKFLNETYTDKMYKEKNEEIERDWNNIEVEGNKKPRLIFYIETPEEVLPGIYQVKYSWGKSAKEDNSKIIRKDDINGDMYAYFIKIDNEYYLISKQQRYDDQYNKMFSI